jgi:pyruvate dehydrogenase E2 component (dihydrolipoamide acetyltransferase)
MRVERAVAVVLAGALGVACEIYAGTTPPPGSPQKPPASAAPAAPPPPAAAPATPAAAAPASTTPAGKKLELHLGGAHLAPSAPAAPAAGTTPAPASACLDSAATTVADCSTMQAPSPTCAAFTTAQQRCAGYKNNFTSKVAAATVACLASSTPTQMCDATRPSTCAKAALAQACPDANVAQLCQIAAGPCKSTAADCTAMLSGLNAQGQQAIAQCVATGCTTGLAGCLDTLK